MTPQTQMIYAPWVYGCACLLVDHFCAENLRPFACHIPRRVIS